METALKTARSGLLRFCMVLLSMTAPFAASSHAASIVTNGGFNGGTYTSTINGHTNDGVPNGWTPNEAFDLEPFYNRVFLNSPFSNTATSLSIGNYDAEPTPTISQLLTTVVGQQYRLSFVWGMSGYYDPAGDPVGNYDPGAFLDTAINGVVLSHLVMSTTPPPIPAGQSFAPPTLLTLAFVGTGADLLSFSATTDLGEWYLSEVSVAATPIPAALPLFLCALAGLGVVGRYRRGCAAS
jgi:hypothetical protein